MEAAVDVGELSKMVSRLAHNDAAEPSASSVLTAPGTMKSYAGKRAMFGRLIKSGCNKTIPVQLESQAD